MVHARRRGEGKNRNRTHTMRLIVVCLRTSQTNFPSHPYPSGSIPTPPPRIRTNQAIGESPMMWATSALLRKGRLPAVGSVREAMANDTHGVDVCKNREAPVCQKKGKKEQ